SGDTSLVYSSFLGGSRQDEGEAIAVDPAGNLFVAGWTKSDSSSPGDSTGPDSVSTANDFPTTTGAFKEDPSASDDRWVVGFVASFPEPEPSPTPSPTPTATATATATPTATPASQAVNLSTRLHVLTGDQVGIGGIIITGSGPKHVIVRAIGPSLTRFGIPNP